MKEFQKYPSIDQFRNTVKKVKDYCKWNEVVLPVITFTGRIKLHSTNACIGYSPTTEEVWAQSRSRILEPGDDNYGFAAWVSSNTDQLKSHFKEYISSLDNVYFFGEWCGGSIQKNVAISGLPKMFVVFNTFINDKWLPGDASLYLHEAFDSIKDIGHYTTYSIDIDFNFPERSIDTLQKITEAVENRCPIGAAFGIDGTGEGVVWSAEYMNTSLSFKVKGDKHSSSKVKVLASVDIEKLESINSFVDYAVTDSRLSQGFKEVFTDNNIVPQDKNTGDIIRWVIGDIRKEESDTFEGNGLIYKDVNSAISKKVAKWFLGAL